MNGLNFLADTNFLIAVHEGDKRVDPFLDGNIIVSVISEIELLGFHKLSSGEKAALRALLDDCIIFDLTADIRKLTIEMKQQSRVKTPDAIIAATAKYLQIPLVTSDKGFNQSPESN